MAREHLGELEHQVLLALARTGPESYSVPVLLELEERTGREVAAAAVYIALRRLEEKKLVVSKLGPPGELEGGRDRRYFTVTRAGYRRLREHREALQRLWDGLELEKGH
jgi:DNA-binding PadR family transcriptional regulator